MSNEHIAVYLNDHLAGARAAVELLESLEKAHKGTEIGLFAAELRAEIESDRQELAALISRLNTGESTTRKASAWLTEKFGELKLWLEDSEGGDLRLFESLEALSLGIEGKRSLWRALAVAAEDVPAFRGSDYERLIQRAENQRKRVEKHRLEAAKKALRADGLARASSL